MGGATGRGAYIARSGSAEYVLDDLEATGAGNMPRWAAGDPQQFWIAADAFERANARTSETEIITLPRGLTAAQHAVAAKLIAAHRCGERYPYTWAIHNTLAADGLPQPHVHLMYSTREMDGIERDREKFFRRYNPARPEQGGARKTPTTGTTKTMLSERLKANRAATAAILSDVLADSGVDLVVDPRTNVARGLPRRAPQLTREQRRDPEARTALDDMRNAIAAEHVGDLRLRALDRLHQSERRRSSTPHPAQDDAEEMRHRASGRTAEIETSHANARKRAAAAEGPRPAAPHPRAQYTRMDRAAAVAAAQDRRLQDLATDQAAKRMARAEKLCGTLSHSSRTTAATMRRDAVNHASLIEKAQANNEADLRMARAEKERPTTRHPGRNDAKITRGNAKARVFYAERERRRQQLASLEARKAQAAAVSHPPAQPPQGRPERLRKQPGRPRRHPGRHPRHGLPGPRPSPRSAPSWR